MEQTGGEGGAPGRGSVGFLARGVIESPPAAHRTVSPGGARRHGRRWLLARGGASAGPNGAAPDRAPSLRPQVGGVVSGLAPARDAAPALSGAPRRWSARRGGRRLSRVRERQAVAAGDGVNEHSELTP